MSRIERVLSFFGVELADENLHLRSRIAKTQDELDAALIAKAVLESAIARMEEEIGMWRAKVRTLESEKNQLAGDVEEQNARINDLLAELARKKSGAEQLQLTPDAEPPSSLLEDEVVSDTTREEVWRLVGVFFDERHWWHLQLGDLRIKVPIPDKSFLDQVAKRQIFFAAGDAIRLRMRTVTHRHSDGDVYAKFFAEEVLGVIAPDRQINLQIAPPAVPAEQGVQP